MSTERAAGRRATDRERTHLRRLELIVRNFIAHFEDHPAERFAPRTRQMGALLPFNPQPGLSATARSPSGSFPDPKK